MAVGGGQVGPPGAPGWPGTRPPAIWDVRDFGAVPGDTSGATLLAACEAARAAMVAYKGGVFGTGVTLKVPAGKWYTKQPILIDLDFEQVVGDGIDATIIESVAGGAFSPLVLAVQRAPNGVTLSSDHWVDLNGKMDFATGPGTHYGIRTKTNAHVAFVASAWNSGGCSEDGSTAYWSGCRQLTIDFCVDWLGQTPPSQSSGVFGLFDKIRARPFYLEINIRTYMFRFALADRVSRTATFGVPAAMPVTGEHQVSIQIDTLAGTVQAYVGTTNANRVQVAVTIAGGPPTFTPQPFFPNEITPFILGGISDNVGQIRPEDKVDKAFYGLQLYRGLRYKDLGATVTQTRLDNNTINDTNAFSTGDPNAICSLINTAASPATGPSGLYGGRLVRSFCGPGSGYGGTMYGWFISSDIQLNSNYNNTGLGVRDLTLKTASSSFYGQALQIGGVFGLRVQNVGAYGGWQGIGSLWTGGSWYSHFTSITCNGYDACFALEGHIASISQVDCGYAGTTAIRLHACSGSIDNVMVNSQPHRGRGTIQYHYFDGANNLEIEKVTIDNEGHLFPSQAVFLIEANHNGRNLLTIRDAYLGLAGRPGQVAAVYLADNGAVGDWPAKETAQADAWIEGIIVDGDLFCANVVTEGVAWRGTLRGLASQNGPGPILNNSVNGQGRIRSEHHEYRQPPRSGWWYQGTHDLNCIQVATGTYGRLRCIQSGAYGTATKPVWTGDDIVRTDDMQAGAYVMSEDFMTAAYTLT